MDEDEAGVLLVQKLRERRLSRLKRRQAANHGNATFPTMPTTHLNQVLHEASESNQGPLNQRRKRTRSSLQEQAGPTWKVDGEYVYDNNNAYREHLDMVLRHVFTERADYMALFDEQEQEQALCFLQGVGPAGKALVARLFQRKGPWFRTCSLERYYSHRGDDKTKVLEDAIKELGCKGILKRFCAKSASIEDALQVAETVLTADEVYSVSKRLRLDKKTKRKGSALDTLRAAAKQQRTVFGAVLPVARYVAQCFEGDVLIKLVPDLVTLLTRAFSLFYLTSSDSSFQLTSDTERSPERRPFFSPGLLAIFGKFKFEAYDIQIAHPIFPSRNDFDAFETACAIRARVLELELDFVGTLPGEEGISLLSSQCIKVEEGVGPMLQVLEESKESSQSSIEVIVLDGAEDVAKLDTELPQQRRGNASTLAKAESLSCSGSPSKEQDLGAKMCFPRLYDLKGAIDCLQLEKQPPRTLCEMLLGFVDESYSRHQSSETGRPRVLDCYEASTVLAEALEHAIARVERENNYSDANVYWLRMLQALPRSRRRGRWWNRLSINRKHLGDIREAAEACVACILDDAVPINSAYRDEAQGRLKSLYGRKKFGVMPHAVEVLRSFEKEPSESDIPVEVLFGKYKTKEKKEGWHKSSGRCEYVRMDDTVSIYCTVEELAIEHYAANGAWTGFHCEGSLFSSLFALLMWDVIFDSSVPNVFQTAFQSAPLDLFHSYGLFYQHRKAKIDTRLAFIASCEPVALAQLVTASWEEHNGIRVVGLSWERQPKIRLERVAACCGGPLLAAVFKRFCLDFAHWAGGLPDLTLIRVKNQDGQIIELEGEEDKKEGGGGGGNRGAGEDVDKVSQNCTVESLLNPAWQYEVCLVEVKSKNDHLSLKQISWLNFLLKHGCNAKVLKVTDKAHPQ